MFQHIIVPVDGSERSWLAAQVGAVIAEGCVADVELVHVMADESHGDRMRSELARERDAHAPFAVEPAIVTLVPRPTSDGSAGGTIADYAESVEGSMVVMSSTGRGRSAAVLGSVADDVLRAMFGPIIVVGPQVTEVGSFTGDIVVPVDGSDFSETILPMAAAWGIALGATPWIVEVLNEPIAASADVFESSYPHRLANEVRAQSHHDVEFEVLHGPSAGAAIADFAEMRGARMIMMSTHGRTGLERLVAGSTASSVVHTAKVPVALYRPPVFALAPPSADDASGAHTRRGGRVSS